MAGLRKRKTKPKKAARIKRTVKLSRRVVRKSKKQVRIISAVRKKEVFATGELKIEQAKFYAAQVSKIPLRAGSEDLPSGYGQDKIVLQVRDPRWLHTYWELTRQTLNKFKKELGGDFDGSRRALRVYDISHIVFNGKNAHRFFDTWINEHADNWYIDTGGPGRSWCVDLGLLLADGRFVTILRSNIVQTPLDGPSCITDEEWMVQEDMFARLYGMGCGFGNSSPKEKKAWQHKGIFASPGMASMASPVKKPAK